jgi:excinuclease UvrABC nuclease subunit
MPAAQELIARMNLNQELERILAILQADFDACYELTRTFGNLPKAPGIYAIRHQAAILYIGKAADIRRRFQGGHKALSIVLMEDLPSKDVRIAATPVEEFEDAIELLEARLLQRVRPPYNVQYPSREV